MKTVLACLAFAVVTAAPARAQPECPTDLRVGVHCVRIDSDCASDLRVGVSCLLTEPDASCPSGVRSAGLEINPQMMQGCLEWEGSGGPQHAETEAIVEALAAGQDPPGAGGEGDPIPLPQHLLAICENGLDDDGDGAADWPNDGDCTSWWDDSEDEEPYEGDPLYLPSVRNDAAMADENREYCGTEFSEDDARALSDRWRQLARSNGMELVIATPNRRTYGRTRHHDPNPEWEGVADFSGGWTETMTLSVSVTCNLGGSSDLRHLVDEEIRDGDQETGRLIAGAPEMIATEHTPVRGPYYDYYLEGRQVYTKAGAMYIAGGGRYLVTISAESNASGGGTGGGRILVPGEGWRLAGCCVVGPQTFLPAGSLIQEGIGR